MMKKIFTPVLLATAFLLPISSFADDGERHHHKHSMIKKLDAIVDLSDEQKAQLADLKAPEKPPRHGKMMREIVKLDPTSSTYQSDLEALANHAAEQARQRIYTMAERSQEVKAVLTEEQLQKLYAFHAQDREKPRHF